MNPMTYFLGIFAALVLLITVAELLRRRRLRERHTFWWLLAGSLVLMFAVFPGALEASARALGIEIPVNLVFFVGMVVLFLVCIQQSAELTDTEDKTRTLAEEVALLEERVRGLENPTREH